MIIWFLIQSLLTFISFIILIKFGNHSGGAVGMTPFAVLLALAIQFAASIMLYLTIRKHVKPGHKYIFFITNMVLCELSFAAFSQGMPVMNIFKSGFEGFIDRCYTFSSVISGVCMIIAFWLFKFKKK